MIATISLLLVILSLVLFLLWALIQRYKLAKSKNILFIGICLISILTLFLITGSQKIKSDISRFVQNTSPKKAETVYSLLFKDPKKGCLKVINFKDQLIPKIDCCIWMEIELCPEELARVLSRKKYTQTAISRSDSTNFLSPFEDRPSWWSPELIGDNFVKANIKFDEENQQTIFFGKDSSHVYLCDQAL